MLVRRRVGNPQTAIRRNDNIARGHRTRVTRLFADTAIGGGADRWVVNQRVVACLEKVRDAVKRGALPVVGRNRWGGTPSPVGQFDNGVAAIKLKNLIVAGEQDCVRTISDHQLMDDAGVISAQVARAAVDLRPALASADTAVLIDDAVGCL